MGFQMIATKLFAGLNYPKDTRVSETEYYCFHLKTIEELLHY